MNRNFWKRYFLWVSFAIVLLLTVLCVFSFVVSLVAIFASSLWFIFATFLAVCATVFMVMLGSWIIGKLSW